MNLLIAIIDGIVGFIRRNPLFCLLIFLLALFAPSVLGGIANAIYEHLASKLPLSRLQRDLTDSTVLRNVGVPMAHSLIGLRSLLKGLNKLLLNREALDCDLENNWAVVAEGIQTVLRRAGYPSPYEALKALTRTNAHITRESIAEFIESLDVAESVKQELRAITPQSYTGVFE